MENLPRYLPELEPQDENNVCVNCRGRDSVFSGRNTRGGDAGLQEGDVIGKALQEIPGWGLPRGQSRGSGGRKEEG